MGRQNEATKTSRRSYALLLDAYLRPRTDTELAEERAHLESLFDSLQLNAFAGVKITTRTTVEGMNDV